MVDTRNDMETKALGRLYICQNCAASIARVMGLGEGEEFSKLMDASNRFNHMEQEVESRNRTIKELRSKKRELESSIIERDQTIERLQGRIDSMEVVFGKMESDMKAVTDSYTHDTFA